MFRFRDDKSVKGFVDGIRSVVRRDNDIVNHSDNPYARHAFQSFKHIEKHQYQIKNFVTKQKQQIERRNLFTHLPAWSL